MKNRKSIISLSNDCARDVLIEVESYTSLKLPDYFNIKEILNEAKNVLGKSTYKDIWKKNEIRKLDDVNLVIYTNKDGNLSWRPISLIHPIIYVSLVEMITETKNWELITNRFKEFQSLKRINCVSLPVYSDDNTQVKEIINNWWENFEQKQIELAIDFKNVVHTDISNCYPSIYTHAIPWALHGKTFAKKHQKTSHLGNKIDSTIQDMQNGQTNGIPQGSTLMDLLAELVLGYVDFNLWIQPD